MGMDRDRTTELLGALSSLVRASRSAAHRSSRDADASGTSVGVLTALGHGDARPGDLATALHVAPSVVSRAIVPLEQAGLVRRTTDPEDARASRMTLTEAGRAKLAELQENQVELLGRLLADWTDDDARTATAYLDRLHRALLTVPS